MRLDDRGAVAHPGDIAAEGLAQHRRDEALRRLRGDEVLALERLRDLLASNPLHGVDDRQDRHGSVPTVANPRHHPLDHLAGQERPRGVVDENEERVLRHLAEPGGDGLRPRRAARHGRAHLGAGELLRYQDRRLLPARRRHDHDRVDPVGLVQALQAFGQQHLVAQASERLRAALPEPLAAAGRSENGPNRHGTTLRRRP